MDPERDRRLNVHNTLLHHADLLSDADLLDNARYWGGNMRLYQYASGFIIEYQRRRYNPPTAPPTDAEMRAMSVRQLRDMLHHFRHTLDVLHFDAADMQRRIDSGEIVLNANSAEHMHRIIWQRNSNSFHAAIQALHMFVEHQWNDHYAERDQLLLPMAAPSHEQLARNMGYWSDNVIYWSRFSPQPITIIVNRELIAANQYFVETRTLLANVYLVPFLSAWHPRLGQHSPLPSVENEIMLRFLDLGFGLTEDAVVLSRRSRSRP